MFTLHADESRLRQGKNEEERRGRRIFQKSLFDLRRLYLSSQEDDVEEDRRSDNCCEVEGLSEQCDERVERRCLFLSKLV